MPDVPEEPDRSASPPAESFQALYRRFRPQTFAELRGQEHVSLALRNAVRHGRVGHAYLLSGPRGTGKTSSARILAKALNCEAPVDGEPCGRCESCRAIAAGTSFDVHELDAASSNGVEAMRELVARASLATPGRWKVYIVDEVHMLSTAASNALLKTLEEPPAHVVFVLATTEPQKVLATIRSRTQHYEFHLLDDEVMEGLLADVVRQAALELPEGTIDVVSRRARGSARDALSALDQVAAAGVLDDDSNELARVVAGIAAQDVAAALGALDGAVRAGRDPEQVAVELVDRLRFGFLSLVAPSLPLAARVGAKERKEAEALGAARAVRTMELLGAALVAMRDAPEPRITLELAIIRCTFPEADDSPAGLVERLERLERRVGQLAGAGSSPAAPPAGPSPAGPSPGAPSPAGSSSGGVVPGGADAAVAPSAPAGAAAQPPSPAARAAPPVATLPTAPAPPAEPAELGPTGRGEPQGPASSGRPALGSYRRRQVAPAAAEAVPAVPEGSQPARQVEDQPGSLFAADEPSSVLASDESTPLADGADGADGPARWPDQASTRRADAGPPADPASPPASELSELSELSEPASRPAAPAPAAPPPPGEPAAPPMLPGRASTGPSRDELVAAWGDVVLGKLSIKLRAYYAAGRFVSAEPITGGGSSAVFAVPNGAHVLKAEPLRLDVERALSDHFGTPVTLRLVPDDAPVPDGTTVGGGRAAAGHDDDLDDVADLLDAEPASGKDLPPSGLAWAEGRLLEAFPGAEEI